MSASVNQQGAIQVDGIRLTGDAAKAFISAVEGTEITPEFLAGNKQYMNCFKALSTFDRSDLFNEASALRNSADQREIICAGGKVLGTTAFSALGLLGTIGALTTGPVALPLLISCACFGMAYGSYKTFSNGTKTAAHLRDFAKVAENMTASSPNERKALTTALPLP